VPLLVLLLVQRQQRREVRGLESRQPARFGAHQRIPLATEHARHQYHHHGEPPPPYAALSHRGCCSLTSVVTFTEWRSASVKIEPPFNDASLELLSMSSSWSKPPSFTVRGAQQYDWSCWLAALATAGWLLHQQSR